MIGLPVVNVTVQLDKRGLAAIEPGPLKRAVVRALRKAGQTALRDMRGEASKRIRARKRIKSKYITRALSLRAARGSDIAGMSWALDVDGKPVPLIVYPHAPWPVAPASAAWARDRKAAWWSRSTPAS